MIGRRLSHFWEETPLFTIKPLILYNSKWEYNLNRSEFLYEYDRPPRGHWLDERNSAILLTTKAWVPATPEVSDLWQERAGKYHALPIARDAARGSSDLALLTFLHVSANLNRNHRSHDTGQRAVFPEPLTLRRSLFTWFTHLHKVIGRYAKPPTHFWCA